METLAPPMGRPVLQPPRLFKAPRYALQGPSFVSTPSFAQDEQPISTMIDHPRELQLCGMTLRLKEDTPDLPIGDTAELRIDGEFYCVTQADLNRELHEVSQFAAERERHLAEHYRIASMEAHAMIDALLTGQTTHNDLVRFLEHCTKINRKVFYQNKKTRPGNFRAQLAIEEGVRLADAYQDAAEAMIARVRTVLEENGYSFGVVHSPKKETYPAPTLASFHLITKTGFSHSNKWSREAGDPLCQPSHKFKKLHALGDDNPMNCSRCLSVLFSLYENHCSG